MPEWIHNRAEHILAKNPSMPKGEAFAIATQQSHAVGKSPKSYGTIEGRTTAKAKYDTPKDDKKTANPGKLESSKMASRRVLLGDVVQTAEKVLANEAQDRTFFGKGRKKTASEHAALFAAAYREFKEKAAFTTSQYSTPIEGPKVARQESSQPGPRRPSLGRVLEKAAFTQSQYGSTGGFVDFHQVSSQPGFRKPSLGRVVPKEAAFLKDKEKSAGTITPTGVTPAARLSSAMRIGSPKITNPSGPSISDIAKPKGFGKKLPGATLGL